MDLAKVQIKPLAGESDWQVWKYRIKFILNCHTGALEVVQGILVKPEILAAGADENVRTQYEKDLKNFQKANTSAMVVLTNSMTEETLQKVMRFESAREIWIELHKLYEASSENQLYNICMQFFQFKWNESENIAAHLSKLKNLWNELNSGLQNKNEATLPELLLNCKILDILPSEYISFKSSWLMLGDDKRTVDELTTQLCSYEREFKSREKNITTEDKEALMANSEFKQKLVSNKKSSKCNYCNQKGHWVKTCKKWIADGRPPKPNGSNNGTNRGGKNSAAANMTLLAVDEEIFSAETNSDDWFIDNGASRHVTKNSQYFANFEKFEFPHSITVANGKSLPAVGKGSIKIMTIVNGKSQVKFLENVWYVPEISKNLFSVLSTQDKNRNSIFESTFKNCCLKINGEIALQGTRNAGGGLFKAAMKTLLPETQVDINMAASDDSVLQLYHERWGHQDKQHIKSIMEKELNVKVKPDPVKSCEACIYGKTHRLKFGTRKRATKAGELISTDICGPFDQSFRKYKYFAVFKDDYTKFRYCFFLKHKSEVKEALEDFIIHAKNLGHNIREILSDNGGEYDNQAVRMILKKHGISQRLTAPYTPEQNCSERENRTIVEMARTLKYSTEEVDFPNSLWAELINTSTYILNRTGKSSVPSSSPYELWMGKKPRIKHMRIIGSVCYAHVPVQKRRKLDKKATKGYLIGYDGDERYRIYVKETKTVICSRDVIFEEKPSITENVILPLQQDDEVEIDADNNKVTVDKDLQLEEKTEDIQQEESRPRRKISAPKWTKDYIMVNSEMCNECSPEINKAINEGESS